MCRLLIYLFTILLLVACKVDVPKQSKTITKSKYGSFEKNVKGLVSIKTYNAYNQKLSEGVGFYVSKRLLVANLDFIQGSYKAKVAPLGTDDYYDVGGYVALSHSDNLVLLKTFFTRKDFLKLDSKVHVQDSVYSLFREERKLYSRKLYREKILDLDTLKLNQLNKEAREGEAVFNLDHRLSGIVQSREIEDRVVKVVVTNHRIKDLLNHQSDVKSLKHLSLQKNKTYPSHKNIRGFRIKTTMGNIDIRLYNQTPEYRDNFIRLVSDNFYDSLLIHRVITDFLIQTGAADTKHAKKDDMVGWKGPGYTLPLEVVKGLYHKRGAIAASKLPGDRNPRNRCDGSQFYIVSGRKFTDMELDDLEKQKSINYTQEQREHYTIIGGAPYLDGDYTVFGEVTNGMSLVDEISKIETYNVDRPVKDIRINDVEILFY